MKTNQLLSTEAQALLSVVMASVGMPDELDGSSQQTRQLIEQFSPDLAPHDPLWDQFAKVVQRAYPKNSFTSSSADRLRTQVHQFRYVISSQQAEYVRHHYGQDGQLSDEEALARYFSELNPEQYDLSEPARFHNKGYWTGKKMIFPNGRDWQVNYKVVVNFHSEFILDDEGRFLNEIEPTLDKEANISGVVNGASFNYAEANGDMHDELDVYPTENNSKTGFKSVDPKFRRKIIKNDDNPYSSPNDLRIGLGEDWDNLFGDGKDDWINSYHNPDGRFAHDGRKLRDNVKLASDKFKAMIEALSQPEKP